MFPSDLVLSKLNKKSSTVRDEIGHRGLLIATSIISIWFLSLVFLLTRDISQFSFFERLAAILWQTFLYTGLFITAHDAMHGVVFPQNPKINNFMGSFAVYLYALFSYEKLLKKHWLHHNHPASEIDPDYHDGQNTNFFTWYFYFMTRYWSWKRLLGLMSFFYGMHYILSVPQSNLTLFWVIPSLLSSVQLFYFGTFLPHREPEGGYQNSHRAKTHPFPVFLSFISCYHFSYHEEHHEYPQIPWWNLPKIYQMQKQIS